MGLSVMSEATNPRFSISVTFLRVDYKAYSLSSKLKMNCSEIFEMYASGETVAEITKHLNAKQVKISLGKGFNKHVVLKGKAPPQEGGLAA